MKTALLGGLALAKPLWQSEVKGWHCQTPGQPDLTLTFPCGICTSDKGRQGFHGLIIVD